MSRWALAMAVLVAGSARGDLFSPGELAKPHSGLEGLANCTKCHPEGGRLSQATCLTCHVELKQGIAAGTGLHGRIAQSARACETCHVDHQGLEAQLINWGPAGKRGFEHSKSGWSLKGKHAGVKCDVCHDPRRIEVAAVTKLLKEHPERRTLLGLGTACASCHFDEHRGQFEAPCHTCHQETGWKPAPAFSHDATDYPLKGLHTQVGCAKCHASETDAAKTFPAPVSETFLRFAPLEATQCTNCHKDEHDGRFGAKCSSCHSVNGWRVIRNAAQERGFHENTRFKLKGEHLDVPCTSCHGPSPGRPAKFKNLAFGQCTDCHADAHVGQLTKADCKDCHSVEGFTPPRFTLADHQRTPFALEGAHQVVGCGSCHQRQRSLLEAVPAALKKKLKLERRPLLVSTVRFDMKTADLSCGGCHADVHRSQFTGKTCETCHTADSFHQLRFVHDADSRFALTGKHAQVPCAQCHPQTKTGAVRYKPLETGCASCHADPHVGQFKAAVCSKCHSTEGFAPATEFKHAPPFTTFLLEGRHAEVACSQCHQAVTLRNGTKVSRFVGAPTACEGCHADFHKGVFEGFAP